LEIFRDFPHLQIKVADTFGAGNRWMLRVQYIVTASATKPVHGVDIFRVEGGLIREIFSYVKGPFFKAIEWKPAHDAED
jgi:hypothetical protein